MFIVAGLTVAVVSIGWPKFTNSPEPVPLIALRTIVEKTPLGARISDMNVSSVAGSFVDGVGDAVKSKASEIVVHQAVEQITSQFNNLSTDQKKQIQDKICKPDP